MGDHQGTILLKLYNIEVAPRLPTGCDRLQRRRLFAFYNPWTAAHTQLRVLLESRREAGCPTDHTPRLQSINTSTLSHTDLIPLSTLLSLSVSGARIYSAFRRSRRRPRTRSANRACVWFKCFACSPWMVPLGVNISGNVPG